MEIIFNDLSFVGQFESEQDVEQCINEMFCVTNGAVNINGNAPIRRTEGLKNRCLVRSETIYSFMLRLYESEKPSDRDLNSRILDMFVRGPYVRSDEFDLAEKNTVSICGKPVDGTALHAHLSRVQDSVHAVISATNSSCYSERTEILISKRTGKNVLILNFSSLDDIKQIRREYQANTKHEIREDRVVSGEIHTRMDLDAEQASECLINGFKVINSQYVYGYMNQRWYEFRPHLKGVYHGFPIDDPMNNATLNRIKRVFGNPPYSGKGYQFCLGE